MSSAPTWQEVLDCKVWFGHISKMAEAAKQVGYVYFIWNDVVYHLTGDDWERTEHLRGDIR